MPSLLDGRGIGAGKRTRLHRLLGHPDGRLLLLPYDHGIEHGPRDFFANPPSADPRYVIELAIEAGMNGVVLQIGPARKCFPEFAGRVPLVVKLNGKTEIPPDDEPLSPLNATVEEALALGADAVGYTLYVGSPRQDEDLSALREVRLECERYGMPLIVWAYPRGSAITRKGGRDSFYAIDYAARVAAEVGADVVKINWPSASREGVPREYDIELTDAERLERIVRSAGRTLLLLSGGDRVAADLLLERAALAIEAGAAGLIFGRNFLKREWDEAVGLAAKLHQVMTDSANGSPTRQGAH